MKTVVEVKDLVKRYKELVALDHFQLSIKEGEIFGLLGPNGSGKTTTIHCILGLLSYDKGEDSGVWEKDEEQCLRDQTGYRSSNAECRRF